MKLVKVVQSVPVPTGGTATRTIGWYLVENGVCAKVELWNVYTPRVCKTEEEQIAENGRCLVKQKNNWRKLEKLPYGVCEGYEDLLEIIKLSKEEYLDNLKKEREEEENTIYFAGGLTSLDD